jgi:hypothetical protein
MTQTHDDPKENAAGSEARAGAPVRGVRTADPLLVPSYALCRIRPGRFYFQSRSPASANHVFKPTFPSRGPTTVAGPIIRAV